MAGWRGRLSSKLVLYGTTQMHSIAAKAALILGLDFRALPVSAPHYSLDAATLTRAIEQDQAQGRVPFLLIATIGTTSSGAVDNLTEIVSIAQTHPTVWLHIDADEFARGRVLCEVCGGESTDEEGACGSDVGVDRRDGEADVGQVQQERRFNLRHEHHSFCLPPRAQYRHTTDTLQTAQ